jgi:hypothetical protein
MRAMIPKNIPSEVCGDGGFVGDPKSFQALIP